MTQAVIKLCRWMNSEHNRVHHNKVSFLIWIVLLFCHIFMPVVEDFCYFVESAGWGKPCMSAYIPQTFD